MVWGVSTGQTRAGGSLPVVRGRSVFSEEVLAVQRRRKRVDLRIQDQRVVRHLGDLLERHGVVNGVLCVGSPDERSVRSDQGRGHFEGLSPGHRLDDDRAGGLLVGRVDLFGRERPGLGAPRPGRCRRGSCQGRESGAPRAHTVAHVEWVCATPPIDGNAR